MSVRSSAARAATLDILITNLLVAGRSGTEVVTEELADGLRRAGCRPVVWVSHAGEQARLMRVRGHQVIERLDQLARRPDVIHGHHNVMTMTALAALPGTPAVFTCHDADAPFDAAPLHPRVKAWLAVDALCRDRLIGDGVPAEAVRLLPNPVDEARFRARPPLPDRPQRALALVKDPAHLEAVRSACAQAGIDLDELGPGAGRVVDDLPAVLPGYDLVFGAARTALEAAFVGCAVVVCDARGLAGLLTLETLDAWRAMNFGRGALAWPCTAEALGAAIAAYDAADATAVGARLRAEARLDGHVARLLQIYREALAAPAPDPDEEARALGRFLEDHLPSYALDRRWPALAVAVSATRVDPLGGVAARIRDTVLAGVNATLAAVRGG